MRLTFLYAVSHARQTVRTPAYWIAAMAFPLAFFLLFGIIYARRMAEIGIGAEYAVTPFILFTTLNVTLGSLAGHVAADRESPWERRLRLLPVSAATRFSGRLLYVAAFNVVSWIPLLLVASLTTDLRLGLTQWPLWLGAAVLGAVPFGLLGIAVGYQFSRQAAAAIANILFLTLSFLGGLFIPVEALPTTAQNVVPFIPSQQYLQFVHGVLGYGERSVGPDWTPFMLIGWAIVFGALALVTFRRDEGVRYG